jgi:hypothetical protein|eukprot:COSAG06_NODE_1614_length_8932_cov_4.428507_3_plen_36_part_00
MPLKGAVRPPEARPARRHAATGRRFGAILEEKLLN